MNPISQKATNATKVKSNEDLCKIVRKSLLSDAQFRLKNLHAKLLRLIEAEIDWKPYQFDFKNEKDSNFISGQDRNEQVTNLGKLCDELGWSTDTKFSALELFDTIVQTTKLTKQFISIFTTAILRLAAKLNEEIKTLPPSMYLLQLNKCEKGTVKDLNKMEWILLARIGWQNKCPLVLLFLHVLYAIFCQKSSYKCHTAIIPTINDITEDLWSVVCCSHSRCIRPSLVAYSLLLYSMSYSFEPIHHRVLLQLQNLIKVEDSEVTNTIDLIKTIYKSRSYIPHFELRRLKEHNRTTGRSGRIRLAVSRKRTARAMEVIDEFEEEEENTEVQRPLKRKNRESFDVEENSKDDAIKHPKFSKLEATPSELEDIYSDIKNLYANVENALGSEKTRFQLNLSNQSAMLTIEPSHHNTADIDDKEEDKETMDQNDLEEEEDETNEQNERPYTLVKGQTKFKAKNAIKQSLQLHRGNKIPCKIQVIPNTKFFEKILHKEIKETRDIFEFTEEGEIYVNDLNKKIRDRLLMEGSRDLVEGAVTAVCQVNLPGTGSAEFPLFQDGLDRKGITNTKSVEKSSSTEHECKPLTYAQVLRLHLSPQVLRV